VTLERALKALVLVTNCCLTLAFLVGWFQHQLAPWFGFSNPLPLHVSVASISVILSLFSDTCVLFYFIGTGVWIKDRAHEIAANKDLESAKKVWAYFESANKLKAKSFPFASMGLLLGVFSFILGGAHQVGAISPWVHPLVAFLLVVNGWIGLRFYKVAVEKNLFFLDAVSGELDAKAALNQI
jgi:hypothetical protein